MKNLLNDLRWQLLRIRQKMLIPDAYFNESKRKKLCHIDQKLIKIKREEMPNGKT